MFPQNPSSVYSPGVALGGGGGGASLISSWGFIFSPADHTISSDSPISPNSQFMYELDSPDCFTASAADNPLLDCGTAFSYADDALMMLMKNGGSTAVSGQDNIDTYHSSVEGLSFDSLCYDIISTDPPANGATAPPDCLSSFGSAPAPSFSSDCAGGLDCERGFDWDGKPFDDYDAVSVKPDYDDPRLSGTFTADEPTLTQLNSQDLWLFDEEFGLDEGLFSDTTSPPQQTEDVGAGASRGSEVYYGGSAVGACQGSSDMYSTNMNTRGKRGRELDSTMEMSSLRTLTSGGGGGSDCNMQYMYPGSNSLSVGGHLNGGSTCSVVSAMLPTSSSSSCTSML